MDIKVYSPGCAACKELHKNVINAVAELDIIANVEKVEDMKKIAEAGIMSPPALEINGEIKIKGRVPNTYKIKDLIKAEL